MTTESQKQEPNQADLTAAEHVEEAKRRLNALRTQWDKHPDLEAAIERLELALSILTTKSGGML